MLPFKSLARFVGVLLVGSVSFVVAHSLASDVRGERVATRRRADSLAIREGPSLLAVYIGSSRCAWCLDPAVPGLLQGIHRRMTAIAESLNVGYRMAGVAVDRHPSQGLDHLRRVGPMFAEVSSGGEWQGLFVSSLIIPHDSGVMATPQILIIGRSVRHLENDTVPTQVEIADQWLLHRVVGLKAIERWTAEGYRLPLSGFPVATASAVTPGRVHEFR